MRHVLAAVQVGVCTLRWASNRHARARVFLLLPIK